MSTQHYLKRICEKKRAFPLRVKAEVEAIARMNNKRHPQRSTVPLYVYQCDVCGLYHLTKKQPKP